MTATIIGLVPASGGVARNMRRRDLPRAGMGRPGRARDQGFLVSLLVGPDRKRAWVPSRFAAIDRFRMFRESGRIHKCQRIVADIVISVQPLAAERLSNERVRRQERPDVWIEH